MGKATVAVTLAASNSAVTPATFHFAGLTTTPGTTLFFSQRLVSGPGDAVFMNTGTGPCANVTETDGTDPPRDVTRRDSLGVTLTGVQANYQGLWWNSPAGSESGWGVNFAHQGDTIFASWFTYNLDDPAKIQPELLGSMSLTFADGNNATLAYAIGPISQHKALTRQVFRAPGTVCR